MEGPVAGFSGFQQTGHSGLRARGVFGAPRTGPEAPRLRGNFGKLFRVRCRWTRVSRRRIGSLAIMLAADGRQRASLSRHRHRFPQEGSRRRSGPRGLLPPAFFALGFAPASSSASTMEGFMLKPTVQCRGVDPPSSREFTLATASARQRVTSDAAAFSKNVAVFLAGRLRRGCRREPPANAGSRQNFRRHFLSPGTKLQPAPALLKEASAMLGRTVREFKPTASAGSIPA